MNITYFEKKLLTLSLCVSLIFTFTYSANAMHIMEGYLPLGYSVAWSAISLPFIVWGTFMVKRIVKNHKKALLLLAMMGAYAFVLSALKIPSVTGSSSHPTGTGLGAILFGAPVMAVIGMIVLLFQTLLLAHGGLTTLGANVFSMAIVGPFISFFSFKFLRKMKLSTPWAVGIACALGDLLTYCVTAGQLALAHPSVSGGVMESLIKFLTVFAVTQIPLAIIEGVLSAIVIMMLESFAKPELQEIGYFTKERCYE